MYKLHYDVNAGKQVNVVYKGMEIEVEAGEGGEGGDIDIQTNKEVTLNANGTYDIVPAENFDVMKKVTATVNVPTATIEEYKSSYIGDNGIHYINPSSGYDAMESVQVNVDVPGPITEANRIVNINQNGTVEVLPSNGNEVMEKVTAVVNVPSSDVEIETNKTINIVDNGTVEITPSSGKDAMAKVTATVNVPTSSSDVEVEENKEITIRSNGTVEITPSSGKDAMSKVTATINVTNHSSAGATIRSWSYYSYNWMVVEVGNLYLYEGDYIGNDVGTIICGSLHVEGNASIGTNVGGVVTTIEVRGPSYFNAHFRLCSAVLKLYTQGHEVAEGKSISKIGDRDSFIYTLVNDPTLYLGGMRCDNILHWADWDNS